MSAASVTLGLWADRRWDGDAARVKPLQDSKSLGAPALWAVC